MLPTFTLEHIEPLLPAYRDKWVAIGLATGSVERPAADDAITQIYRQAGLAMPHIVVAPSPLSGAMVAAILQQKGTIRERVLPKITAHAEDIIGSMVWSTIADSVKNTVVDIVWESLLADMGKSVGYTVWADIRDDARASISAGMGTTGISLKQRIKDSVLGDIRPSLRVMIWDSASHDGGATVREAIQASIWGNMETDILAFYDFLYTACGVEAAHVFAPYCALAQSCGWWMPYEHLVILQDRPVSIALDTEGRLHHPTGAACLYRDGWGVWAWHGVRVPQWVIEHPEQITLEMIAHAEHTKRRDVLIERYGLERYANETYGAFRAPKGDNV